MRAARELVALESFTASPFPLRHGRSADGGKFFDVSDGERRGRTTRHGEVFWENPTYSDRRVLLAVPAQFDTTRAATLVVFLHGHRARLERDVLRRQQLVRQVSEANINAVLVAPQFALDAPDSSAGRFALRGVFGAFLDEAAHRLARLCAAREDALPTPDLYQRAAVVIVAYSGGYSPAAAALSVGRANRRIRGVVLLDALYDHEELFAAWFARRRHQAALVSAYTHGARRCNLRLRKLLAQAQIPATLGLKAQLEPGAVCLVPLAGSVDHADVVTRAWTIDPIANVLRRIGPASRP